MKYKIFIIIAVISALCLSVYALTKYEKNDSVEVYYADSKLEKFDIDEMKTGVIVKPKLDEALFTVGETVLSVPWGKNDETFKYYINEEMSQIEGPQSFVIGDYDDVYVYDTFNNELKKYHEGILANVIDFNEINKNESTNICSMAYVDNSIYALDSISNIVYKIKGNDVEQTAIFGKFNNVESIMSTPYGNIIIRDYCWKDGSISIKKYNIDGDVLYERKMGFYVSDSAYCFDDASGNTIRMIDNGFKSYIFVIENSEGELIDYMNFSSFQELPNISNDGNGFDTSMKLIGTDNQGRIYAELLKIYYNKYTVYKTQLFVMRLDINKKAVDTIEIPVDGDNEEEMIMTSGMQNSTYVTSDGIIYKAYMSIENGSKIVKYNIG